MTKNLDAVVAETLIFKRLSKTTALVYGSSLRVSSPYFSSRLPLDLQSKENVPLYLRKKIVFYPFPRLLTDIEVTVGTPLATTAFEKIFFTRSFRSY